MNFKGSSNSVYRTGKVIGRGGEGVVYDLASHPDLVLKQYNEPLTANYVEKLALMVGMHTPSIAAFAAWPSDIVTDDTDHVVGFVMRKLTGFLPLHMAFSPMERKKLFPDKGYNFLVHIARNLAAAFHKLHEQGLIVGDVNEGNILINAAGLVCFIDCDSFQIKGPSDFFYCEVGVPRYTPPELLRQESFSKVMRTVNTDSFSLGILIFQLLFLGRHPFAGINKTNREYDEEKAIKEHEFAYSTSKKRKVLHPPENTMPISYLPERMRDLFHQTFETEQRSVPANWLFALDELLAMIVTCNTTRLHTYPALAPTCPWCHFKEKKGILYFLDDSQLASKVMASDIHEFVNGFNVDDWLPPAWEPPDLPYGGYEVLIDSSWLTLRRKIKALHVATLAFTFLCMASFLWAHDVFDFGFASVLMLILVICIFHRYKFDRSIKRETTKLKNDITILYNKFWAESERRAQLPELQKLMAEAQSLSKLVQEFRNLPALLKIRQMDVEERQYNHQLNQYLSQYSLLDNDISGISHNRKAILVDNGILTAAHINNLSTIKVPGIGPKRVQILLAWQRQISVNFVYQPDLFLMNQALATVQKEIDELSKKLETTIRVQHQQLSYRRNSITNALKIKDKQLDKLYVEHERAQQMLTTFMKTF